MNRRGVLGMLGLGAAVGPAVVSNAVSPAFPEFGNDYVFGHSIKKESNETIQWNPVENLASAKREYDMMTGDSSKWIAEYAAREWDEYINGYNPYRNDNIDPDIRNMRSFSETAKMRMHIERKAKRKLESNKNHVWSRIQQLMKEI
jgi:hypothetical protein